MQPRRDDSKKTEGAPRPNNTRRGARAGAPGRGRGGYAFSHQHMNSRGDHDTTNTAPYLAPSGTIQRWHQNAPWAVQIDRQPPVYPPPLTFGTVPAQNYATSVPPSFGFIPGGMTSNPNAYQRQYQQVQQAEDIEMGYVAENTANRPLRDMPRRPEREYRRENPPSSPKRWKGKGKQREFTPESTEDDARNAKKGEDRAIEWRGPPTRQGGWGSNAAASSSSSSREGRQSQSSREFQITFLDDDISDPDHERREDENRKRVLELERTIREASKELKELQSKKHGRSPSNEQETKRARRDERSMDERSSTSRATTSSYPRTRAQSPVAGPSRMRDRSRSPGAGTSRQKYEQRKPEARATGSRNDAFIVDYNRRPTFQDTVLLEEALAPPEDMVPRMRGEIIQEVFDFPEVKYPRPNRREMIANTAPEGEAPSIEGIRRRNAAASEAEHHRSMEEALDGESDYGEEEFDWRYETIAESDTPEERANKKKHNQKVDGKVREQYNKEKALYYAKQGRSPFPQVEVNGREVRDHELGGIIIPRTFLHRPSNVILVGKRAEEAIEAEETGSSYNPPKRKDFPFPYGLPMSPREVREGIRIVLHNTRHRDFVEIRYLLCWFHRIAAFVIPELRDWAMWDVLAAFTEHPELGEIEVDQRTPPPFIRMTSAAGTDYTIGLTQPEPNATLVEHMTFAILYQAPGTVNYPRGLVMAYNNYVYVPTVLAWMILRLTGPNGNPSCMREYTRHLVSIAAIPGRFTDLINQWNEREPQDPLRQPPWSPTLYHLRVGRGHQNIDEFLVVRHLLHCGITQRIVDTMYAWGVQYAYSHARASTNVFHLDHLRLIDVERRRRLAERGAPEPMDAYNGWWTVPRSGENRLRYIIDAEIWGEEYHKRTLPEGGNRYTKGRWFRVGASPFRSVVFSPEEEVEQHQGTSNADAGEDVEMTTDEGGKAPQNSNSDKTEGRQTETQPNERMEVDTATQIEEGEVVRTEADDTVHIAESEGPNRPEDNAGEVARPKDPNRSEAPVNSPREVVPTDIPLPPSSDDGEI